VNVKAATLTVGRTFGQTFADGDDFFPLLVTFCADNNVKQGYIPCFIGAFRAARIVGTCQPADPTAPMLDSAVEVAFVETFGTGTVAYDPEQQTVLPHVHLSVGERLHSADTMTSHLFGATVQFLVEMVLVEVLSPTMVRTKNPALYDLALLSFDDSR
jgi:predicted DNA-binding protein with PD1-like motif